LLINDTVNAKASLENYFNGIFQGQIDANGEQPEEAARTHPYHYRAYNLGAAITNARIGDYLGLNYWNKTTKAGGTIQKAIDYAMAQDPATSHEPGALDEMWQIVACAATVFGDPDGKYKQFLSTVPVTEAFMAWDYHGTITASTILPTSTTTSGISAKATETSKKLGGGGTGGSMESARLPLGGLMAVVLGAFGLAAASLI